MSPIFKHIVQGFCCCILLLSSVHAQEQMYPGSASTYQQKGIVYNNERTYGATINPNGFSVEMTWGKIKTYKNTQFYYINIGYLEHPFAKSQNKNLSIEGFGISKNFKFAKQNQVYLLRGGIGQKYYVSEKAKHKGIALGWTYGLGPVLSILKPYGLISITKPQDSGIFEPKSITYAEDPDLFMDYNAIFGRSTELRHWRQLRFKPGIQAKIGALFAFGAYDQKVRVGEIGVKLDYFFTKLPIIVANESNQNKALFLNLYLTLHFGNRN